MKFVIGIDEAGRGPLAGPVTVGSFGTTEKTAKLILKNFFDGNLRDSKKLSEKKREEIFAKLSLLKKEGSVSFEVSHSTPKMIDKMGISYAIKTGIEKCLENLNIENYKLKILLDGLLKAPAKYKDQETIIKGDESSVFIACASIVAKVSRDRLMRKLAKKYPLYGFEIHKGYGTALHRNLIKKLGPSIIHRRSFCKNI